MKKILILLALLIPSLAQAQTSRNPCFLNGTQSTQGVFSCQPVSVTAPLPVGSSGTITGATPIQGNASGTTGAVVSTLAAAAGKTTYICDFDVSAAGTGASGPITIAGLLGGSKIYQLTAPGSISKTFTPCLPASAVNTAITITTTANANATAVNINSSGYQQ